MKQNASRFFSVMVIGDNPDDLMEKYDKELEVDKYCVAKYEDIEKYKDTYKVGWEAIRNARYERQKQLGIFPNMDNFLSDRQFKDKWEDNPHAEWDARAMAVHAAMIDRMDQGIGQVIDALEKTGQLENTLILFLSDNGCSNEDCQNYSPGENDRPDMTRKGEKMVYPHNLSLIHISEPTRH